MGARPAHRAPQQRPRWLTSSRSRRPLRAAQIAAATAIVAATAPLSAVAAPLGGWTETLVRSTFQGRTSLGVIRPTRITSAEYAPGVVQITWSSWALTTAKGTGRLLRCASCPAFITGETVRITLLAPREQFCGDPAESIGHYFSRIRLESPHTGRTYRIVDNGRPNAC